MNGLLDYSVEAFLAEVRSKVTDNHWTLNYAFGQTAQEWALYCNRWVRPNLTEEQYYKVVALSADRIRLSGN